MRLTHRVGARSILVTVVLAAVLGLLLDHATRPSPPMELREVATLRRRGLPPLHGK